jgi:protein-tyrosine sulfotransferase
MKNLLERKSHFQSKILTIKQNIPFSIQFFNHRTEHSSDQVIKPINLEALTKWFGHMPLDVKQDLDTLAPMLKKLGYDTQSNTPSYGTADSLVLDNMNRLKENADFWKDKAKFYARQAPNGTNLFRKSI